MLMCAHGQCHQSVRRAHLAPTPFIGIEQHKACHKGLHQEIHNTLQSIVQKSSIVLFVCLPLSFKGTPGETKT